MPKSGYLALPSDVVHASHAVFTGTLEDVHSYDEIGAYLTVARDGMTICADAEGVTIDHGSDCGVPARVSGRLDCGEDADGHAVFGLEAAEWDDPTSDDIDRVTLEALVDYVDGRLGIVYVWHAVSAGHWERWPLRVKDDEVHVAARTLHTGNSFGFEGRIVLEDPDAEAGRHVIELDNWSPLANPS
jgi:hypothetical protein